MVHIDHLGAASVVAARIAVLVSFGVCGLQYASLASRLVLVRQSLGVSPSGMGLLLLVVTAGSVATMPLTGRLVERFGEVRVIRVGATLAWTGLLVGAVCATNGWALAMAVPLFLQGVGIGSWDVAQNLAGSRVEQAMGRAVMSQFHAAYSLATLAGAGVGWLFASAATPLLWHIGVVAVIGLAIIWPATLFLLAPAVEQPAAQLPATSSAARVPRRSAWLEPRTLLIGVVMLSVSLTEGSANDWVTSAVVQSFNTPETVGIACLGVFLAAMTLMRFLGTKLVDAWGRVTALRACAVCAIIGLALFGFGGQLWLVMLGAAFWGLGAALGFPVGISAASDDPLLAARRTAVVSTIGYLAFLGGPPLLGVLAGHVGFRPALTVILVPAVASLLLAGRLAPLDKP